MLTTDNSSTDPNLQLNYGTNLAPPVAVFHFDGSKSLAQTFGLETLAFPTEMMTFALWLNTAQANAVVLTYGPAASRTGQRLTISNPANLEISLDASSTGQTGVSLNDNVWHHLAIVLLRSSRTSYRVQIYKDGWLAYQGIGALVQGAESGLSTAGQLVLGNGASGANQYLIGYASNFQLWDKALSQLDLLTNMQRRLASNTRGLLVNWLLENLNTEGPNNVDSFTPSTQTSAPLRYRNPENVAGYVVATWTPEGASNYTFQMVSTDGQWRTEIASAVSPLVVNDVLIDRGYQARLGVVSNGSTTWFNPVALVPLDLGLPAPVMSWPEAGQLTATWQALDQAQSYQVALYKNAETAPSSTSTQAATSSTALDAKLDSPETWILNARARSVGSRGPANDTGSLDKPLLTLIYAKDYDNNAKSAFWLKWSAGAAAPAFLYATLDTGTQPSPKDHWAGNAAQPHVIPYTTPLSVGTQVTGRLRSVTTAALSLWDNRAITVRDIVGPNLNPLQISQTQVTATWEFDNQNSPTPYEAQLYSSPASPVLVDDKFTSEDIKTATLNFSQIAAGTVLYVRVRAQYQGNMSRWSQSKSFRIGSTLLAPTINNACVDTSLNISAAWTTVTGAGAYKLVLTNPTDSSFRKEKDGVTGTTYQWLRSETGVQAQTAYQLTVTATAQGQEPSPESSPKSFNTGQLCSGNTTPVVADPINQATGQYTYANLDMLVNAVVPLQFITYYTSPRAGDNESASTTPLGPYWNHSFNIRIEKSEDNTTVSVLWGDGRADRFQIPQSLTGQYVKLGRPSGELLYVDDTLYYTLTMRDQMRYRFDPQGVLLSITARDGNVVNLTYNNGRLEQLTDAASGRYMRVEYNSTGQIQFVKDNANRQISFDYFPTTFDLKRVTNVNTDHRDFTYLPGSLLETATDENNVMFVKNTYYDNRRIKQQLDANQKPYNLDYETITDTNGFNFLKMTLTDPMGYKSVYLSNVVTEGLVAETHTLGLEQNAPMQVIARTFDGLNNLLSETFYEGPPLTLPLTAPLPGNTTSYTYDGSGNVRTITDPLGNLQCLHYDERNNLIQYTDLLNNVTRLSYDGNLLKSVTSPLNFKTEYQYRNYGAALNRLHTITDYPGNAGLTNTVGNVITLDYDNQGQISSLTDPYGNVVGLEYDAANHGWLDAVEFKDKAGTRLRRTKLVSDNAAGWINHERVQFAQQTEAQAFSTSYLYDGLGNIKSIADPLTYETIIKYNAANLLSKIIFPAKPGDANNQTIYAYDDDNRLSQITYSETAPHVAEGYTFDPLNRLRRMVDGNLKDTLFDYSMLGVAQAQPPYPLLQKITFPKLDTENEPYQVQMTTDALDRITKLTDVTIVSQQPQAPFTSVEYTVEPDPDNPGLNQYRVLTTLPKASPNDPNYTITVIYDAQGRVKKRIDERGKLWQITHATENEPSVNPTSVKQVATLTDPLGNKMIHVTDAFGRLVKQSVRASDSSADLQKTEYEFDVLSRLIKVKEQDANGAGTLLTTYQYGFNAVKHQLETTVSPYGGTASVYGYDGNDQWVSYTDAQNIGVTLGYTPSGQLETYSNARQQTLTYGYDAAGRFTKLTLPGGSANDIITQDLDGNGNRRQTLRGATPVITREFDALNRMTSRTRNNEKVSYTYWPSGELHKLTYPGLETPVVYEYDGLQRLKTVTDWHQRPTLYNYYPTGQLSEIHLPGGVVTQQTVDDAGRFTGFSTTAGNILLAQANYGPLDAAGRPTRLEQIIPLAPTLPVGTQNMAYSGDRLNTIDGQVVVYDNDGNMTSIPGVNGTLAYNALNQLVSVDTTQYNYDEDGLRETIVRPGLTRRYIRDAAEYVAPFLNQGDPAYAIGFAVLTQPSDGVSLALPWLEGLGSVQTEGDALDNALIELDGQGNGRARYVYGHGLISREGPNPPDDYRLFIFDGTGSTLALFAPAPQDPASGVITDRYAYSAYGDLVGQMGTTPDPFLFHGRYGVMDDRQGLLFMRARYYCPHAFRFTGKDFLFGDNLTPQTLNRYAFLMGNPLQRVDPLGLSSRDTVAIVSLAAGLLPFAGVIGAVAYSAYTSGAAGATAGGLGRGGWGRGGFGRGPGGSRSSGGRGGRGGRSSSDSSESRSSSDSSDSSESLHPDVRRRPRRPISDTDMEMQTFRNNVNRGSGGTTRTPTGGQNSQPSLSSVESSSGRVIPREFSTESGSTRTILSRTPKKYRQL